MQSVLEVLKKTEDYFTKKGIENARLNAELLLAEGLECKRLDLYLRFDEVLSEAQLERLRKLVARRGNREPLQYIVGDVDFMDLTLKVDNRAIVPRPETEELVERLLEYCGENKPKRILDLGTGCGALALALAHYCPEAEVVAVDKSGAALALAYENASLCGLEKRVEFKVSDWFEKVEGKFDWIVSNPPYLSEEEWDAAAPEVKEYEPKEALVAEEGGLGDLMYILEKAREFLVEGGWVAFETGIGHHEALAEKAKLSGYSKIEFWEDLSGRDRFFVAHR